jgi:hypothetical protein
MSTTHLVPAPHLSQRVVKHGTGCVHLLEDGLVGGYILQVTSKNIFHYLWKVGAHVVSGQRHQLQGSDARVGTLCGGLHVLLPRLRYCTSQGFWTNVLQLKVLAGCGKRPMQQPWECSVDCRTFCGCGQRMNWHLHWTIYAVASLMRPLDVCLMMSDLEQ